MRSGVPVNRVELDVESNRIFLSSVSNTSSRMLLRQQTMRSKWGIRNVSQTFGNRRGLFAVRWLGREEG
jgi:hypothetical protein